MSEKNMEVEKLIFSISLRLIIGSIILALLTSCNPYAEIAITAVVSTEAPSPIPSKLAPTLSPSPAPHTCTVRTGIPQGSLNIRTGAGVNHSVIQILTEGQRLTLTAEAPRGHWIQVTTTDQVTGWINSRYCEGVKR